TLGDSDRVQVGEDVVAIGNPLGFSVRSFRQSEESMKVKLLNELASEKETLRMTIPVLTPLGRLDYFTRIGTISVCEFMAGFMIGRLGGPDFHWMVVLV